jgi:hypothetical protein
MLLHNLYYLTLRLYRAASARGCCESEGGSSIYQQASEDWEVYSCHRATASKFRTRESFDKSMQVSSSQQKALMQQQLEKLFHNLSQDAEADQLKVRQPERIECNSLYVGRGSTPWCCNTATPPSEESTILDVKGMKNSLFYVWLALTCLQREKSEAAPLFWQQVSVTL